MTNKKPPEPDDYSDRVRPIINDRPGHKGHVDGYTIKDEYKIHEQPTVEKGNGVHEED